MPAIQHIFVLMLENRSFDHMLGFSGISGKDAVTGQPTSIDGLTGNESNVVNGAPVPVLPSAGFTMPADPGHEFNDVLEQLCGAGAVYPPGGAYPSIDNSGFASSYVRSTGQASAAGVMQCYSPAQLPVLNALAREFAVCDRWFGSLPGPTWPNRFFVHAASSGGLDHSPTTAEIILWETFAGFNFPNGTIYDALKRKGLSKRLYAGDEFPLVAALKGVTLADIQSFDHFTSDVAAPSFPFPYVMIEPKYNVLEDYKCGTSQHPLDDVTRGDALIKCVYEALRNSPLWPKSLLIVTWDEHGGFYDHVAPPAAVPPGDTAPDSPNNQFGFTFDRLGPRVPAVVVSPLIPQNIVDHRIYDHSSIPATVEAAFGIPPLTARDRQANHVLPLLSLAAPRDTPKTLPAPAASGVVGCAPVQCGGLGFRAAAALGPPPPAARPRDTVNDGNVPGVLQAALRSDLELAKPAERDAILARVSAIRTRGEAKAYIESVRAKVRSAEPRR